MSWHGKFCQRLGIDLIRATRNELAFLEEVDEYRNLYRGPVVREAIRRYELLWLPLTANSRHYSSSQLAAPLDVAWVWHVHMLAPYYYAQDCLNIVGKLIDHSPLDRRQRYLGLRRAEKLWRQAYPGERFVVDFTKPPTVMTKYQSKIQYNLEEACSRQFKFYYQVSLPHYRDDLFLEKAVERYEHHLRLKSAHPDVFMVPCYDVDLIWHAHQLHPLNYRQTTKELLGKTLHHDDTETSRTPGSKLYDSEMNTRAVWKANGLHFARPGAMYRGEPPDPVRAKPKWLYAPLARSEYPCEIQGIEALNLENNKSFIIRLENKTGRKLFSQSLKGNNRASNPRPKKFTFDNGTKHTIDVCLYKKKLFGKKFIAKEELHLLRYFAVIPFVENAVGSCGRITVDVPLNGGQYTAMVTIDIGYPTIVKYSFEVQPEKVLTHSNHPSLVLSSPSLMLSPSDIANTFVPCNSSTHPVFDWKGNQVFSCRVVHSSAALLSAAEIISVPDQVLATAHTILPSTLPERDDVEDHKNKIFLNQAEGERAMLIRGRKDWAVCIGKWQKESQAAGRRKSKSQHFVRIKVYKLVGERGWCSVRKSSGGLFVIKVDSDTVVRIDLNGNKVVISPGAQDIPEVLALAFSVSILHLLCMPYSPRPLQESTPAAQTSYYDEVSPSFYSAGYLSTRVPTNVYLRMQRKACIALEAFAGHGCYDFNHDSSCDWIQGSDDATSGGGLGEVGPDGAASVCFGDAGGGGCVGDDAGGGCVGGGGACAGGDGDGGCGDGGGCGAGGGCGGGGCGGGCGGCGG